AQVDRIDHRDDRAFIGADIDSHRFGDVARLAAIEEHRGGISLKIQQTASPADRFRQRQPPGPERNLLLRADPHRTIARSAARNTSRSYRWGARGYCWPTHK